MPADAYVERKTVVNGKLRLFSLYVDFAASAHTRWATGAITKLAGPGWQCSTEMWNLDSLTTSGSVRKMIAAGAAEADVLIVAASSLDQREPKLIEWLDSLAGWNMNRAVPGLLIGLFGDEENRSRELEWTVQQFIYCARQMRRELAVQWMERDTLGETGWLAGKVEPFLTRKQSACGVVVRQETTVNAG